MPKPAKKARQRANQQARAVRLAEQRRTKRVKIAAVVAVLAALVIIASSAMFTKSSDKTNKANNTDTTDQAAKNSAQQTPCPLSDGSSPRTLDFKSAPPQCTDPAKNYVATFDTTEGRVAVALDTKRTPKAVNSFVYLARYHYFDDNKIFRTDTSIDILQSGSPHTQTNTDAGPGYNLDNEGGPFSYSEGDLVMARGGTSNSAGQFFFGAGPKVQQLNTQGNYITIGKTTTGVDVLRQILSLNKSDPNSQLGGAPSRDVTIKTVTITES